MLRKARRTAVKVFLNGKYVSWLKLACDRHYQILNPIAQVFLESAQPCQTISKAGLESQVLAKIHQPNPILTTVSWFGFFGRLITSR